MKILHLFLSVILVIGCAEKSLLEKENEVLKVSAVHSRSNLESLGNHSAKLSVAYRKAARAAIDGQDAAAVITFLSAAAFVGGAVGGAVESW